ncbi:family 78 glycoside hydrolase catalytic domain [Streptomyces sp. NPDC055144]
MRCGSDGSLRHDDKETYEPRFTFHGFRYVEGGRWGGVAPATGAPTCARCPREMPVSAAT